MVVTSVAQSESGVVVEEVEGFYGKSDSESKKGFRRSQSRKIYAQLPTPRVAQKSD